MRTDLQGQEKDETERDFDVGTGNVKMRKQNWSKSMYGDKYSKSETGRVVFTAVTTKSISYDRNLIP